MSDNISPLPFRGGAGGGGSPRRTAPDDSHHPNPSSEEEGLRTIRFAGYAAIFNRIDKGGDIIRPGAFASPTLAHPELVEGSLPLLWQHSPEQRIGSVDYIREDRRGLRVIGSVLTATRAGRDAAAMLKDGALKGLSFGYRVKKSSGQKPRELLELDVAEISLVTFPMQGLARVHLIS